ncbi:MAG: hypothetical protein ACYCUZ_05410 [Cuniculiplasma sp.]
MSSTGFNIGSILKPIFSSFNYFLLSIVQAFSGLFTTIFGSFGNATAIMFTSFGASTTSYGIAAPIVFVGSLGGAIIVAFGVFMIVGPEKDITEAEDDL